MKILKSFILPLAVLSISTLTGCNNKSNVSYDKLEERITQLEQEVAALKQTASDNSADHFDSNSPTDSLPNPSDTASDNTNSDTIETLSKAVDEVTAKTDSATPSGNTDEKRSQFFNLKEELDSADHRLDRYDDYIESQYKQGNLSYDDYLSQEHLLQKMEDKLDVSEDKLEQNFGIAD